jgi:N utilization substance protein A
LHLGLFVGRQQLDRVIARIKEFMSDTSNRGRILFLVMTNRPDRLDLDLKRAGRLDRKIPFLYSQTPEEVERVARAQFRKNRIRTSPDPLDLVPLRDRFSAKLVGYSNADVEAVVPAEERARGERYNQNDPIVPILIRVEKPESSEPQLVLSRATPLLVQRLFEREAPEIEEGVVEIRAVAREAGVRTKIAVASNNHRVDAVGTFVGVKGSRVQSVMRELNGERIDVIPWTMDRRVLVSHALLPATVLHVEQYRELDPGSTEERSRMIAVVPDDHLSLAIGKNGHNVRLAGELVGSRIDIETQTLWEENRRWEDMLRVDASEIPGMSDKLLERLRIAGFDSANAIADALEEDLLDVHGVGPVKLEQMRSEAQRLVEEKRAEVDKLRTENGSPSQGGEASASDD